MAALDTVVVEYRLETAGLKNDLQAIEKGLQGTEAAAKKAATESQKAINSERVAIDELKEDVKELTLLRNKSHNPAEIQAYNKQIQESRNLIKSMIAPLEQVNNVQATIGKTRTWNGLGNSINQLTRELPAFTNSLQTGFMAISNNIPIAVDEINRLKEANKALAAEGQPTKSVLSQIGGAVFSLGTAMSIGITLLTVYGAKVVQWIGNLFSVSENQKRLSDAVQASNDKFIEAKIKAEQYFNVLNNQNNSEEARRQALVNINKEYGKYIENQLTDINDKAAWSKAQNEVIKGLQAEILLQIQKDEQIKRTKEVIEAQKSLNDQLEKQKGLVSDAAREGQAQAIVTYTARLNTAKKSLADLGEETKKLAKETFGIDLSQPLVNQDEVRSEYQQFNSQLQKLSNDNEKLIIKDKFDQQRKAAEIQYQSEKEAIEKSNMLERHKTTLLFELHRNYILNIAKIDEDARVEEEKKVKEFSDTQDKENQKIAEARLTLLKQRLEAGYKLSQELSASADKQIRDQEINDQLDTLANKMLVIENSAEIEIDAAKKKNEEIQANDFVSAEAKEQSARNTATKIQAIEEKLNEGRKALQDSANKEYTESEKKKTDATKVEAEKRLAIERQVQEAAADGAATIIKNQYQAETDEQRRQDQFQISLLDEKLKKKTISQKQYNEEVNKIKHEEDQREKERVLFGIAIDTAAAIVKDLLVTEGANIPKILALSAIEAAVVAAKPLPKYRMGGWVKGKTHEQGGEPVEAEAGEFIVNKSAAQRNKDLLEYINKHPQQLMFKNWRPIDWVGPLLREQKQRGGYDKRELAAMKVNASLDDYRLRIGLSRVENAVVQQTREIKKRRGGGGERVHGL